MMNTIRNAAIALAFVAAPASAATLGGKLVPQWNGATNGGTTPWYFSDTSGQNALFQKSGTISLNGSSSGTWSSVNIGAMRYISDFGTAAAQNILVYCIELGQSQPYSASQYPGGAGEYTEAQPSHVSNLAATRLARLADQAWDLVTNSQSAAAFQLAVWETVYDVNASQAHIGLGGDAWGVFSAGSSTAANGVTSATIAQAQSWAELARNDSIAVAQTVTFLASDSYQDFVTFTRTPPPPVPLPAGAWLMLSGVGAFAALRRRKAKQA